MAEESKDSRRTFFGRIVSVASFVFRDNGHGVEQRTLSVGVDVAPFVAFDAANISHRNTERLISNVILSNGKTKKKDQMVIRSINQSINQTNT